MDSFIIHPYESQEPIKTLIFEGRLNVHLLQRSVPQPSPLKLQFENVVSAIIRIIYFRFVIGCKGLVSKEFKQSIEKQSWPQPAQASSTSPVIIVIFSPAIEDPGTPEIDLSVSDDDFTQNDLHIFLVLTD